MGKIQKLNAKANRKLKELFISKDIRWCELNEPHNCNQLLGLTFAHRYKRRKYRKYPELLWDFDQVLLLCMNAHQILEINKNKTAEVFERLRGDDRLKIGA